MVDAIGLLDERFGIGCFEDDDYCLRAIQAGFRAVIAGDAFIHHYGGRTFVGSGVDCGSASCARTSGAFAEKWAGLGTGRPPVHGEVRRRSRSCHAASARRATGRGRFAAARRVAERRTLRLGGYRQGPRLSLCMIVRDSARTLPACLESIRPWVDEMVIVDTGSVDETPRIVESFGGRLFHFPWCDDFSAARNESLRHARGDWLFWMDSDDTIPPECGRGSAD